MVVDDGLVGQLHASVLDWFSSSSRNIWWRRDKQDPWVTLVTEIMSQQTQMERVASASKVFLSTYPSPEILAKATNADVVRAWKGMGYNNRAIRLRDCARRIVELGGFPREYESLLELPGVGPYTAAAMCSFCFGADIAVIDVNIERVYSRVFSRLSYTDERLKKSAIRDIAESIVPNNTSRAWHQAIMDIGATFCKARHTSCVVCPIVQCQSRDNVEFRSKPTRKEPRYKGRPRRLWRGAIVSVLREQPLCSLNELGERLDLDHADGRLYLQETIGRLVSDDIVEMCVVGESTPSYKLKE